MNSYKNGDRAEGQEVAWQKVRGDCGDFIDGLWTNVVHHSQNMTNGWRHLCGGYEICEQCSWSNEHQAIHDFSKVLFQGLLPVELYVQ